MARFDALVDACHKRARPIVMTTIAMASGMLPAALSLMGGDSSFRQPMAIVVIGGVVMSTLLSLIVIPVIFTFVDDFEQILKRVLRRLGLAQDIAGDKPHASNDHAAIAFQPEQARRGQCQR
jgi:Cu/Ag efflux pump CusA